MIVKLIFDKDKFKTQNKQHNVWSIRTTKGILVLADGQARCKTALTSMLCSSRKPLVFISLYAYKHW